MKRRTFLQMLAGGAATVSLRALIMRLPPDGSFAQGGTSPQRSIATSRAPASLVRTTGASWLGAMLKRLRIPSWTGTRNVYAMTFPSASRK